MAENPRESVFTTRRGRTSRRAFVRGGAGLFAGGLGLALVGCGDDDDTPAGTAAGGTTAPLAATTAAGAATAPAAATPKAGGKVTMAWNRNLTTLDPKLSTSALDPQQLRQVYDTLVDFDSKANAQPMLAASWETPAPTTWVFKLRDGVTFHDGTKFDSTAVKKHFETAKDTKSGSTVAATLSNIQSIEAPDPLTVRITLGAPNSALLDLLYGRAGMIISPTAVEKFGKDTAKNEAGAGPFRVKEFVTDSKLVLERDPTYWDKGKVFLDELIYRIIVDPTTQLSAFESGEVDVLGQFSVDNLERIASRKDSTVSKLEGGAKGRMVFDMLKPPFNEPNLRQAVAHAIGFEDVLKVTYKGNGKIQGRNFYYPSVPWAFFPDDVPPPAKDPAKAKALLSAAGKPNGFEFTAITTAAAPEYDIVRANLAAVGIKITFDVKAAGQLVPAYQKDKVWDSLYAANAATSGGTVDPASYLRDWIWSNGRNNPGGFGNAQTDEMLRKAEEATKLEERSAIYKAFNKVWCEDFHELGWYYVPLLAAFKTGINGLALHPDTFLHFKGVWRA